MKSTDNVGITFANIVLGRGIFNGVVNVTLGAYEFNPDDKNEKVEPSPVIVSRLRFDVPCAKSLRDALSELLLSVETPPAGARETADAADGAAKH